MNNLSIEPYNISFWIFYIVRTFHMVGVITYAGYIIIQQVTPCTEIIPLWFQGLMSLFILISGITLLIIYNPKQKMQEKYKFWAICTHIKLLLTIIILNPIFNIILNSINSESQKVTLDIQMTFIVIIIVVSPFLRFYREKWTDSIQKQLQEASVSPLARVPGLS